jgi:hypothetical protein
VSTNLRIRPALAGIALLSVCGAAAAKDVFWNGVTGDFYDFTAWSSGEVPTPADRAVFSAGVLRYTVGFSASAETAGFLVTRPGTTFDLGANDYFVFGVGEVSGGGNLDIENGFMLASDSLFVGGGTNSSLSFVRRAAFAGPAVYVGHAGPGRLSIEGTATFETGLLQAGHVLGRAGTVIVDGGVGGAQRTFLGGSEVCNPFCNVGVGPGELSVINGGRFDAGALSMGKNGNAAATVSSNGLLTASTITLSQGGNASLTVRDGGTVRATSLGIEAATAATPGTGSVSVLTGGTLEVDGLAVGPASYLSLDTISADRRLTVSGAGAQVLVNGALQVKGGGSRMDISQGGYVESLSALLVGSNNVAAEVTVTSGGVWKNTGAIEVANRLESASRLTIDGGRIETGSFYFVASTACVPFCNVVNDRSDLVVRNGGILSTGNFFGGRLGEASIRVESGGLIESSGVALGSGFRPMEAVITGPQSAWINSGDASLGLHSTQPTGTVSLRIENGGLFKTGTLNTTALASVFVSGGTLEVGDFGTLAGVLDFQSGRVITHGNLALRPGAPLGASLLLQSNRSLSVGGTTTIDGNQSLVVDGGRFSTGSLQAIGQFSFVSGVFAVTSDAFVVGGGGLLGSAVVLTDSRRLEVTNELTVVPNAMLNVTGDALSAGTLRNGGTVQLNGGTSRIATATLENAGRLLGGGTIQGSVDNVAGGQVRVLAGQELAVTGGMRNSGQVFLLGGTVQVSEQLEIAPQGFLSGRGVLDTGSIKNLGTMAFSGTTDVIGDLFNEKDGAIVISGGATLTFYDDVVHNGAEIRASPGSNAVFFGAVEGAGKYTGGGDFFFEGDLRPGNSPAITDVTGNATLGPSALEIEIAGLIAGLEHDAVHVSGNLTLLGGTLDVFFLSGYMAGAGDSFDLLDFANLYGQFSALNLPTLANGLTWDSSRLYTTGELSVQAVPEPGTYALLLAGLLFLGGVAARRRTGTGTPAF